MLKELVLRRAQEEDTPAIEAILDAAFAGREDAAVSAETTLCRDLRSDGDLLENLCVVADRAGEVVGTVTCSRGFIGDRPAVALGPIAVPPHLQRRGIGAALVSSVIVTADQAGEAAIVLLGDAAYYDEFWFEPAAVHGITISHQAWREHLMVRILQAWRPEMAGEFHYPVAFEAM